MKIKILAFVLFQAITLFLAAGCSGTLPQVTSAVITATSTGVIPTATAQTEETALPIPTATNIPEPTAMPAPPEILPAGVEIKGVPDIVQVGELGASWVRRNALWWFNVEPEPGVRNWNGVAGLEEELRQVAAANMQMVLIVRGAPEWAQQTPGLRCGLLKQDALDEFAAFLTDAVQRYKEPPYNVKYWELGNEPDIDPSLTSMTSVFGCMGDIGDPNYYGGGKYAELLKAAYPAIKAADAEAQVIVGGLLMDCDPVQPPETASGQPMYCTPSRYLEGILVNGGGDYFERLEYDRASYCCEGQLYPLAAGKLWLHG
jgi:hypothetical protein